MNRIGTLRDRSSGETQLHQTRLVAGITEHDVLGILENLANDMATLNAASVRDFLRAAAACSA